MKFFSSFSLKVILPYLVLGTILLLMFLVGLDEGNSLVAWLSFAGILLCIMGGMVHIFWLKRPLNRVRNLVVQLTRGSMPTFSASGANDEIGDLERNLEKLVGNLRSLTSFTGAMAAGDFTGIFEKRSSEDEIGEALLSLKESLMASRRESESRREEEEHRTWTAQGLAKFSKLFSEAEDDLPELSRELMRELVDYTEADVGALFILQETEGERPELELTGSYAFDREKYIHHSFGLGEGLVGRAALEKEVIYLTDLPEDYIKIRSGLGEDRPSSLYLVPVMFDNKALGVIELASLGEIPAYQREFIRQLGDALATTLAKVKANLQNRQLFEQTRMQAEALTSQEKIFRQKMEELEIAIQQFKEKEALLHKEIDRLKSVTH